METVAGHFPRHVSELPGRILPRSDGYKMLDQPLKELVRCIYASPYLMHSNLLVQLLSVITSPRKGILSIGLRCSSGLVEAEVLIVTRYLCSTPKPLRYAILISLRLHIYLPAPFSFSNIRFV